MQELLSRYQTLSASDKILEPLTFLLYLVSVRAGHRNGPCASSPTLLTQLI